MVAATGRQAQGGQTGTAGCEEATAGERRERRSTGAAGRTCATAVSGAGELAGTAGARAGCERKG